MNWRDVIPIIVALVGLGSALGAGYLAGRRQARLEYAKETRLAVAEVTKSVGIAVHAIAWFTWKARFRGTLLLPSDVIEYDRAMNETFPALTGSLAVLAALKHSSYARAKKIIDRVYDLDERVAKSATLILKNEEGGPEALGALHQEARDLEAAVNERFAEVMTALHEE
jgi:hypothetical protein